MCCSRPLQCELHFLVGLLPLVFGLKGMFDVTLVWMFARDWCWVWLCLGCERLLLSMVLFELEEYEVLYLGFQIYNRIGSLERADQASLDQSVRSYRSVLQQI
jgi:hypothetical protein